MEPTAESNCDIKVQFVAGKKIVTDMRGKNFVGKEQGDHHRTVAEIPNAPQEMVDVVLREGPSINAAAAQMFDLTARLGVSKEQVLAGASALMGEDVSDAEWIGLQVRVYDHD